MDSTDKFNETTQPSIEKFYSKLQLKNITNDEYNHAKKVWEHFEIKTLGDYHELYVQADTAQLSNVFENFRSLCLKEYQLDPAYFVSTPSLAFEAMLKITKAKIELFTDIDMILMTEKEVRGGLTQVIRKYGVANNKYLPNYDKLKDADDKACLLEVDVEYPKELHSAHEDLPFLPEKRIKLDKKFEHKVTKDIKKAHEKVYKTFNITHEPENKLIATVQDKNKYVVTISTLKQATKHGLRLLEVHRVIEYNQSNWLIPYIDKNTALRKVAKNKFEKDFFKLMNNSVFGKMTENVRKRREIKLIVTEERRKKLVSDPSYASCTTFSDHLMAVEMRKIRG